MGSVPSLITGPYDATNSLRNGKQQLASFILSFIKILYLQLILFLLTNYLNFTFICVCMFFKILQLLEIEPMAIYVLSECSTIKLCACSWNIVSSRSTLPVGLHSTASYISRPPLGRSEARAPLTSHSPIICFSYWRKKAGNKKPLVFHKYLGKLWTNLKEVVTK